MMKVEYEDDEIVEFIIESLLEEYNNIIYILELIDKCENIKLEEVHCALLNKK